MKPLNSIIRESLSLTAQLIGKNTWLILALLATSAIAVFPIEDFVANLPADDQTQRIAVQLTLVAWGIVEGLLVFIFFSWSIPQIRNLNGPHLLKDPFKEPYMASFLAECLRMCAIVVLWLLALIVGSFYKYARLIFVPYIALFSADYRAGRIDALEASHKISARPRLWPILGALILTTILGAALEFAPNMNSTLHSLPARLVFVALGLLISTWTYSFIYLLFEDAMKE